MEHKVSLDLNHVVTSTDRLFSRGRLYLHMKEVIEGLGLGLFLLVYENIAAAGNVSNVSPTEGRNHSLKHSHIRSDELAGMIMIHA